MFAWKPPPGQEDFLRILFAAPRNSIVYTYMRFPGIASTNADGNVTENSNNILR